MLQTVHRHLFEGFADREPGFATAGIKDVAALCGACAALARRAA